MCFKVNTYSVYNGGILSHTGSEGNPASVLVNLEVGGARIDTHNPVLDNTESLKNRNRKKSDSFEKNTEFFISNVCYKSFNKGRIVTAVSLTALKLFPERQFCFLFRALYTMISFFASIQ